MHPGDALHLDGESLLKSIEAQHGLLVERARGIYSFSHLTFQEYFTSRYIADPTLPLQPALKKLATHITEKRYREVFRLTVGMLPQADDLLRYMKHQVDRGLAQDLQLQAFLAWVWKKAHSTNTPYKNVAVRAYYLSLELVRVLGLVRARALKLACDLDTDLSRTLSCILSCNRDIDIDITLDFAFELVRDLDIDLNLDLSFALDQALIAEKIAGCDPKLKLKIQELKAQLPNCENPEAFRQWLLNHGQSWVNPLRTVMIEHRNIGHDWQFTDEQKAKLQQYYDANKLLVDCLNSDCYVTKATRQYIEDTLLLPMSEIEKYEKPEIN